MIESSEEITVNEILAEVLRMVEDTETRQRPIGWYKHQIKMTWENLCTDFYLKTTVWDSDYDNKKLQVQLPSGMFNIKQMFIHNGQCCAPQFGHMVHYKPNFINAPGGTLYTANREENQTYDPYYNPYWLGRQYNYSYWANVVDGVLMLSPTCAGYSKIRIVFSNYGSANDDMPMILRWCRTVVVYKTVLNICACSMARDAKRWSAVYQVFNDMLMNNNNGIWWEFYRKAVAGSTWQFNDLTERNTNAIRYQ